MIGSPRAAAVGRFVGGALLLCVLGAALLVDVGTGLLRYEGTGLLLFLSTAAAAAGAFPAAVGIRLPPAVLAWAACGVALVSLACSVGLRLAAGGDANLDEASDTYTLFEPAALMVLLHVTARRGSPAGTAVALPLLMAAVILRPLVIEVDEGSSIVALVLTLVASGALASGLTVRLVVASRRQREEQIRLEQRLGFARDLHDYVAHHISGIVVQAQGARAVAAKKPQAVGDALELIETTGAEALTAMRKMVGALREDTVPNPRAPGTDAVRALVADFRLPGARAGYTETGPADSLPADAAHLVERVVMEALTNIRKHARDCTTAQVHLDVSRRRVTARITDDGTRRPSDASDGGGYGLRGLREVTGAAGGTLTAGPGPESGPGSDAGWHVALELPLPLRQVSR
ncbi:sensor histidine kinase [Streptomyces poonensis]|uniref:histidine kinase n=1 Tax=Streptomyces poonensis TaxID=68255 RepID=A0A918UDN8_9ACTN|nr:histidine kinase [Streptomyces poonensis]GGY93560.1 two-component sensor histidine kinase [Streptomyces poonensis]GLJ87535.1 two-component sensor histidine kinase [Streptomyces poonensis]